MTMAARLALFGLLGALASGCTTRVDLGRRGAIDGGARRDGGAADGGEPLPPLPAYELRDLEVTPAVVNRGQRGVVLAVRVVNVSDSRLERMAFSFEVSSAGRPSDGFAFTPRDGVAEIPPLGEARFSFDVTVPADATDREVDHRICVRAEAISRGTAAVGPRAFPCTSLLVQEPAALSAVIKAPRELMQGESKDLNLVVANAGAATLRVESADLAATSEALGEWPAGLVLARVTPLPLEVRGGTSVDVRYRISAGFETPLGVVWLAGAVAGRDGNDPLRAPLTASPTPEPVEIVGRANLFVRETRSLETQVFLGQGGIPMTALLDNTVGREAALIETVELRFLNERGDDVSVGWSARDGPTGLGSARRIPAGEQARVSFVHDVRRENLGQAGENFLWARVVYRSESRPETLFETVGAIDPGRIWVALHGPPPILDPGTADAQPRFGSSLATVGLVTFVGESWPAIAVGAPDAGGGAGSVFLFQVRRVAEGGIDARRMPAMSGEPGARFGAAVTGIGNWESGPGDRSAELAVGAPAASALRLMNVRSSFPVAEPLPESFTPCSACERGAAVAANPRGLRDATVAPHRLLLAVGAPGAHDGTGQVDIVWQPLLGEGNSTDLRHLRIDGEVVGERFGAALAVADIDGDGDLDVLVGAPGHRIAGDAAPRGRVVALRAPTYSRVAAAWSSFVGEDAGDAAGTALAGVGDVDGDGSEEVAVGAPGWRAGGMEVGRVYVLSGATGQVLGTLDGRAWEAFGGMLGERLGSSIAALRADGPAGDVDFNGDRRPDFAVGAPVASPGGRERAGAVYVYSGKGGGGAMPLIVRYDGRAPEDRFGAAVAGGDDLSFDGFADLFVGAPNAGNPGDLGALRRGRVVLLFGGPYDAFVSPPRLTMMAFEDGSETAAARAVTIGADVVRVRLVVRNDGETPATDVRARLLFRDAFGRAVDAERVVSLPAEHGPLAVPPAPARTTLEWAVRVVQGTPGERWIVSAELSAAAPGAGELAEPLRRRWDLQSP